MFDSWGSRCYKNITKSAIPRVNTQTVISIMADNPHYMSQKAVSFVVATCNRIETLTDCLESIEKQTYLNKQIIVIDNASSDGTAAMVKRRFPSCDLIILDENCGPTIARNRGIERATGDICIFLDDDATLCEWDATSKIVDYFAKSDSLGGVAFTILDVNRQEIKSAIPRRDKKSIKEDYPCCYFTTCGCAIKKSVLIQAGLFWEKLFIYCEELDLSYRILNLGYYFIHSSAVSVIHHVSPISRIQGRDLYLYCRNRCWTAVRNLPWYFAVSMILSWWLRTAWLGLRGMKPRSLFLGIFDSIFGLPSALRHRQRLNPQAVKYLIRHSGRLWC